jgi:hypothetical protein
METQIDDDDDDDDGSIAPAEGIPSIQVLFYTKYG